MNTPLLKPIDVEQAEGQTAEIYAAIQGGMGMIPGAFQYLANSPAMLANRFQEIAYFMQHPRFNPAVLAMVRLLIADKESCKYCIDMNRGLLLQAGVSLQEIEQTREDLANAPFDSADTTLLVFVMKSVRDPHAINEEDMKMMRAQGWTDQEILEAVYHAVNAVAMDKLLDTFNIESELTTEMVS